MRKFRLIVALLSILFACNTFAQKITASDVTIKKGQTAELQVSVEFTEPAWSAEFNIDLPEGITVVSVKKNEEFLPSDKQVVEITGTKVIAYPSDYGEDVFASASGVFAILTLKADESLAEGDYTGTLKAGSIGNLGGDAFDTEDATFKISVIPAAYVEPEGTHQLENGLGSLKPGEYTNISAWGGTWSGNDIENERDWSKFEYLWIKYKDFSGAINFGVMYSEWLSKQSWGDQFKDQTVAIKDPSGVIGIKLDHTSVYEKGNAEENGAYIGDIFSKHIREIFIQATANDSKITIEEIWLGSEEDYLQAVEDNKWVDPTIYQNIIVNSDLASNDVSCFYSKEWAPSEQIQNSRIVNGAIEVNSFAKISKDWDSQFFIRMPQKLPKGKRFKISFDYKASAATTVAMQTHKEPGDYIGELASVNFDTEWKTYTTEDGIESPNNDFQSFAFNLTKAEDMVYYFKNIKVEIDETAITEATDFTPEAAPYKEAEGTHQLAGNRLGYLKAGDYAPGAWGGQWSGNNIANERDWSGFDYLWIKYSGFTGAINFGVMYSEWLAKQSWGDQFKDQTVAIKDPSGVIGIKLDHTSVYEKGNAEENGAYIGDIFSKHIREIFIQATANDSKITIEEIWLGSEEDYLQAVEENKWVDPTVYAAITDDKCFFSKEYPNDYITASTVEDGVIVVNSPAKVNQDYDSQFWIWLTQKLPAGTKFKVTFDYKASEDANIGNTQCHNEPGQYIHWQLFPMNFTTEWQTLSDIFTVPNECNGEDHGSDGYKNDFHSIAFNLSKDKDITYYFKNIKVEIDETAVAAEPEYFEPAPPTGINSLSTVEKNGTLYNLAGQKVDKNFKGIVIENGKKRFNK